MPEWTASYNCWQFIYYTRTNSVNWFRPSLAKLIFEISVWFRSLCHANGAQETFSPELYGSPSFPVRNELMKIERQSNRIEFNLRCLRRKVVVGWQIVT